MTDICVKRGLAHTMKPTIATARKTAELAAAVLEWAQEGGE